MHTKDYLKCHPKAVPDKSDKSFLHINSYTANPLFSIEQTHNVQSAPTPCKHMVSDLFHSPLRGSFHLSLTVLVHYRSLKVFSLAS